MDPKKSEGKDAPAEVQSTGPASEKDPVLPVIPTLLRATNLQGDIGDLAEIIELEGLAGLIGDDSASKVSELEERLVAALLDRRKTSHNTPFSMHHDIVPLVSDAARAVIRDDFNMCFEPNPPERWTGNWLYFVLFVLGVLVRWLILMPLRVLFIILVTLLVLGLLGLGACLRSCWGVDITRLLRWVIQVWAGAWVLALGGVTVHHGKVPKRRPNQVFVCNHTTTLDVVMLLKDRPFSFIGQKQTGIASVLQLMLFPLGNIWFERFEYNDRKTVAKRMKEHIMNMSKPPLLVFPEGVCVNNRFTVMFRKGVFEFEDVEICPVAMRYRTSWSDAFWRNDESFLWHIMRLCTYWCTVVDVHYLMPSTMEEGETPITFASRVKRQISNSIGLRDVRWDGYLKYLQLSEKFRKAKQSLFAKRVLKKLARVQKKKEAQAEEEVRQEEEGIPVVEDD